MDLFHLGLALLLLVVMFRGMSFLMATMPWFPSQTIILDTWELTNDQAIGPVRSRVPLTLGRRYRIKIAGTWSAWPADWWNSVCVGIPDSAPQHLSQGGERTGPVGIDPAFIFAAPRQASGCQELSREPSSALKRFPFQISLDNGTSWLELSPDVPTYNPRHSYIYTVEGLGFPAQFRLIDLPSSHDNYGALMITMY